MKNLFVPLITLTLFTLPVSVVAREYVDLFTPVNVIVADGYLQIAMSTNYEIEGCANTKTIVLSDTHKYFDAYLSLSMTAFVSGKKLSVAIGAPCLGGANWPQISVMKLQN